MSLLDWFSFSESKCLTFDKVEQVAGTGAHHWDPSVWRQGNLPGVFEPTVLYGEMLWIPFKNRGGRWRVHSFSQSIKFEYSWSGFVNREREDFQMAKRTIPYIYSVTSLIFIPWLPRPYHLLSWPLYMLFFLPGQLFLLAWLAQADLEVSGVMPFKPRNHLLS